VHQKASQNVLVTSIALTRFAFLWPILTAVRSLKRIAEWIGKGSPVASLGATPIRRRRVELREIDHEVFKSGFSGEASRGREAGGKNDRRRIEGSCGIAIMAKALRGYLFFMRKAITQYPIHMRQSAK
jgi:hypothetical protein